MFSQGNQHKHDGEHLGSEKNDIFCSIGGIKSPHFLFMFTLNITLFSPADIHKQTEARD